MRMIRRFAGYAAIACALPYLGLKIIWLAGGDLGVADSGMMRDASMVTLNVMTAFMDVIGTAMALAFTQRWGMRVPAWVVLPPMWVGSGLLVRFALAVPVAAVAKGVGLGSRAAGAGYGGPVQSWVYAVVYTEFAGLGIGLMVAFFFYARERWRFAFAPGSGGSGRSSGSGGLSDGDGIGVGVAGTRGVVVPLAYAAAVMAGTVALVHLAWMLGATMGLSAPIVARRTLMSHAINAIDGGLTIAGGLGVLAMIRGGGGGGVGAAISTWIGGGALFAWGLWHLINVLGNTALIREQISALTLMNFVALVQLIAGLVIGLVMLFVLAEKSYNFTPSVRRSPGPGVQV